MASGAEGSAEGYWALKVPEVRRLCQERGLPTEGAKHVLIARLEEQDATTASAPVSAAAQSTAASGAQSSGASSSASAEAAAASTAPAAEPAAPSAVAATAAPAEAAAAPAEAAPAAVPPAPAPAPAAAAAAAASPAAPPAAPAADVEPAAAKAVAAPAAAESSAQAASGSTTTEHEELGSPLQKRRLSEGPESQMPATTPAPATGEAASGSMQVSAEGASSSPTVATETPSGEPPAQLDTERQSQSTSDVLPSVQDDAKAAEAPRAFFKKFSASQADAGSSWELSKDEKALRALLQFHVCTDARRQSSVLNMKYRELISNCYDIMQEPSGVSSSAVGGSAAEASKEAAADVSMVDTPGATTGVTVPVTVEQSSAGVSENDRSHSAAVEPAASSIEGRERLRQQLKAKQQALAQEVQRLRQRAAASVPAAPASSNGAAPTAAAARAAASGPATPARLEGAASSSLPESRRLAVAPSVSQEEREKALKRKWDECVDAAVETERLQARKAALEELANQLRNQRAAKKEERARALKVVQQRRQEEASILETIKATVATSGGLSLASAVLPKDLALAGQPFTSLE